MKKNLFVCVCCSFTFFKVVMCNDSVNEEVFLVSIILGTCYLVCYIIMGSVINLVGPRKVASGKQQITHLLALFIASISLFKVFFMVPHYPLLCLLDFLYSFRLINSQKTKHLNYFRSICDNFFTLYFVTFCYFLLKKFLVGGIYFYYIV